MNGFCGLNGGYVVRLIFVFVWDLISWSLFFSCWVSSSLA